MIGSVTQKQNPFAVRSPHNPDLTDGMAAQMLLQDKTAEAPNIPMEQRQSLGQQRLRHRFQQTEYISKLRNYGLRPDYPIAHVLSLIKLSPASGSTSPRIAIGYYQGGNVFQNRGAKAGVMAPPPRFKKALRSPINVFTPQTYNEG